MKKSGKTKYSKIILDGKLKQFLESRKLTEEFEREVVRCNGIAIDKSCKCAYDVNSIAEAFSWKYSKRGHSFWSNVDDEFLKFI